MISDDEEVPGKNERKDAKVKARRDTCYHRQSEMEISRARNRRISKAAIHVKMVHDRRLGC